MGINVATAVFQVYYNLKFQTKIGVGKSTLKQWENDCFNWMIPNHDLHEKWVEITISIHLQLVGFGEFFTQDRWKEKLCKKQWGRGFVDLEWCGVV